MAVRTRDSSCMKILEGEVNILLDKEAKMWRQQSKVASCYTCRTTMCHDLAVKYWKTSLKKQNGPYR